VERHPRHTDRRWAYKVGGGAEAWSIMRAGAKGRDGDGRSTGRRDRAHASASMGLSATQAAWPPAAGGLPLAVPSPPSAEWWIYRAPLWLCCSARPLQSSREKVNCWSEVFSITFPLFWCLGLIPNHLSLLMSKSDPWSPIISLFWRPGPINCHLWLCRCGNCIASYRGSHESMEYRLDVPLPVIGEIRTNCLVSLTTEPPGWKEIEQFSYLF
jgi:hypothetical protein